MRDTRRQIAEQLAAALQAEPITDASARRELCRSLLAELLITQARERVRAGLDAWTVEEEYALADAVMAALFGLGRLQPLVDDPDVENIEVNGHDRVWVSYADGREEPGPPVADSDEELIEHLQLLAARVGGSERTFTTANPRLHIRLEDGSRLAAMAWTTPRPQVVVRRHRIRDVDLDDLVDLGTLDTSLVAFLRAALRAGKNIVVTGLQNAGKTTLIRALANEFPPMERFATIEREYELHLHELQERHPRVVAMEAREGSSEKDAAGRRAGEVTLYDLVVDSLRMNLRRIIVGEVRGSEAIPMLEAMSTGDGSLCTIHARTAHHALDRIVTLCLSADIGMTDVFAYRLVAGSVDFLVHINLLDESAIGGRRHRFVSEVLEINGMGECGTPDDHDRVRARAGRSRCPHARTGLPRRAGPGRLRPGVPRGAGGHLAGTVDHGGGDGDDPTTRGVRRRDACDRAASRRARAATSARGRASPSASADGDPRRRLGDTADHDVVPVAWPSRARGGGVGVAAERLARRRPHRRADRLGLPVLLSTSREAARAIDRIEAVEEWSRRLGDILVVGVGLEQAITATVRTCPAPVQVEVSALVGPVGRTLAHRVRAARVRRRPRRCHRGPDRRDVDPRCPPPRTRPGPRAGRGRGLGRRGSRDAPQGGGRASQAAHDSPSGHPDHVGRRRAGCAQRHLPRARTAQRWVNSSLPSITLGFVGALAWMRALTLTKPEPRFLVSRPERAASADRTRPPDEPSR